MAKYDIIESFIEVSNRKYYRVVLSDTETAFLKFDVEPTQEQIIQEVDNILASRE